MKGRIMKRETAVWTHPSVVQLAEGRDPVEVVSEYARGLVLEAFDAGWNGPPFDPFGLADLLRIEAVPKHDVEDARTVPVGSSGFRIEFNPSRPRGRLRYSIAHEIAHTLFPDCVEQVRYRVSRETMAQDEWQLEALCNIAAAEFLMPLGSFPGLREEDLGISHLLDLRRDFDVSTEALMIRAARLAEHPCAVFAASRVERGASEGRYRVEYGIESPGWVEALRSGTLLPANSVAAECTAIGFTATGSERWSRWSGSHRVECVGIPPYPGSRHPRVAGIAFASESHAHSTSKIQYLIGDATRPRTRPAVVVQVVNDATANWGGRGFARAVRRKWPAVQDTFRAWAETGGLRLGTVHVAQPESGTWLASLVAQKGYGPSTSPRVRYAALREALQTAADYAAEIEAAVHMPRIGCGEGGGDWTLVEELVRNEVVRRGVPVTVYDLPGSSPPVPEQASLDFATS